MEVLLLFALAGTAAVVATWIQRERWKEAAARLDMVFSAGTLMFEPEIKGTRDGFWVRLSRRGKEGYFTVVDGLGRIPRELELGAENLFTRAMAPDILTGDPYFDHRARITGSEEHSLAVLDRETRVLVLDEVVDGGATVHHGRITAKDRRLGRAEAAVPRLVELAKRLVLSDREVPDRLAANAANDPLPSVRLRNLRVLQERSPASELTRKACRGALASEHPELRLEGGIFLAEEGLDAVCVIAAGEGVEDDLRVRAVDHLVRGSWLDRALPVLEQIIESPPLGAVRVRRAAVEALGHFRHRPAVARLEVLAEDSDARTVEAIAVALGRIGDAAAESSLIRLLSHRDRRVRTAAAGALGRVGTALAVEPLLELTRGLVAGGLKQVAREAVARIQGRLVGGGERGALSVAATAGHGGALSPVEAPEERGGLSLEGEADGSSPDHPVEEPE